MEEQDKTILIPLEKPLADASGKLVWESIELHEPALIEVNQFFEKQKTNGALTAMGHLISLLSGIPPQVVKRIPFTVFKRCEVFLLRFLNYTPETLVPGAVPACSVQIALETLLEDASGKQSWSHIGLSEPNLEQVDQFYKAQSATSGLAAMAVLISELSDIAPEVVNRLKFTDYKRCEGYLLGFLNYSPTAVAGGI